MFDQMLHWTLHICCADKYLVWKKKGPCRLCMSYLRAQCNFFVSFLLQATLTLNSHWSIRSEDAEEEPDCHTENDPVKSKTTINTMPLTVDMSTMEARITILHNSLESALSSLKQLIKTAKAERVPLNSLDLSEREPEMLLLELPMPYVGLDVGIGTIWTMDI